MNNTTRFIDNVLIARYGLLTDGLELDLIVPYWIHGEVKSDFGMAESDSKRKDGFGDLGAALRYEVWYEQGNRPSLIVDISGKSRTGGTWSYRDRNLEHGGRDYVAENYRSRCLFSGESDT